jgi:hypothetical protein
MKDFYGLSSHRVGKEFWGITPREEDEQKIEINILPMDNPDLTRETNNYSPESYLDFSL